MSDDKKIISLPNVKNEIFAGMREAIDNMLEVLELNVEYAECVSKMMKEKYDALIKEGFLPGQAIELINGRSI